MKERPILFSGPMVRALLAGAKTVTRRPVKSVLGFGNVTELQPSGTRGYDWQFRDAEMRWHDLRADAALAACPYGVPGDILWVRETWRTQERDADGVDGIRFAADGSFHPISDDRDAASQWVADHDNGIHGENWRPSIFMRRWACRILLRVTEVSIERIQDIAPIEVLAEGVTVGKIMRDDERRDAFRTGWDGMYGKQLALRWDANPYVWVVRFERVTP